MKIMKLVYYMKKNNGFTLMEIMLVVVIIGILATAVLPRLARQIPYVQNKIAASDITTLENLLETYFMQNGDYPTTEQGLRALVEKPSSPPIPRNWNGPYVRKIPVDPWGNEYKYSFPGEHNRDEFDLLSIGRDQQQGTDDDITNWAL